MIKNMHILLLTINFLQLGVVLALLLIILNAN